ncbi:DNA replication complex GINS protein SLD5 isoform X1 [Hydra vulgaris]|uniref:DNA replication complex GINS protein SLD5 isoform X1 n=1 Tax=Hydra vulgaris TaxID=6087 RepID=UPI001F5FD36F|nr:DNA replication complex GINS protein SLD5 isoform X1 [Hydra vulgaris]
MNDSFEQVESDEEIEVTAKEVYEKILQAWLNEKFSPELLESRNELIECMLAQVKEIESGFIQKNKSLESTLQKVELERVKFVIASYLRERLKKIENNVVHVLEMEALNETSKLSPEELAYAKSYVYHLRFADATQKHLNTLALDQMPVNMQSIERTKTTPRPNLDEYMFIRVNEKQTQVLIDPEEDPLDLEVGSQHIVRFKPVGALVESGAISLL